MTKDDIKIVELDGKKVPIKELKERVCTGKIVISGDVLSAEAIRERIVELARQSGNYSGDGSDLDINYDVDGNYYVDKIIKVPLTYEEAKEAYQKALDEEPEIKETFTDIKKEGTVERLENVYEMYGLSKESTPEEIVAKLDEAVEKSKITRENADKLIEILSQISLINKSIKELENQKEQIEQIQKRKKKQQKLSIIENRTKEFEARLNSYISRIASQPEFDGLREELKGKPDYEMIDALAQRIEDAYNEEHQEEIHSEQPTNIEADYKRYELSDKSTVEEMQKEITEEIEKLRDAANEIIYQKRILTEKGETSKDRLKGYDEAIYQTFARVRELQKDLKEIESEFKKEPEEIMASEETIAYEPTKDIQSQEGIHSEPPTNIEEDYKRYELSDKSTVEEMQKEILEEIEKLRDAANEIIYQKRILTEKGETSKDRLKGYDEAIYQTFARVRELQKELKEIESEFKEEPEEIMANEETIAYEPAKDTQPQAETMASEETEDYKPAKDTQPQAETMASEVDAIVKEYQEIVNLRDSLINLKSSSSSLNAVDELISKVEKLEATLSRKSDLSEFKQQIDDLKKAIAGIGMDLKEAIDEYEKSYERLKKILADQTEALNSNEQLSEEEIQKITDEYIAKKTKENENSTAIRAKIDEYRKQLDSLRNRRQELETNLKEAEALGLSAKEYKEITETMNNSNIIERILVKKGLKNIIDTPEKERTEEQKKQLADARDEIRQEIAKYKSANLETTSVLESIEILYGDKNAHTATEPNSTTMSSEEIGNIITKADTAPVVKIKHPDGTSKDNNDKEPLKGPDDMLEVQQQIIESEEIENGEDKVAKQTDDLDNNENLTQVENNISNPMNEKITLYYDTDNGDIYASLALFRRFLKSDLGSPVIIDGQRCLRMAMQDALEIDKNKNNDYSPYELEVRNIRLGKRKNHQVTAVNESQDKEEELNNESVITDKIVIYRDLDNNGKAYVNFYVIDRFKLNDSVPTVRIDEALCYQISNEEIDKLIRNQNNDYSPYIVEEEYVNLGKKHNYQKGIQKDEPIYDDSSKNKDASLNNQSNPIDKIVIYRDLDNNGKAYVNFYVIDRFKLNDSVPTVRIDETLCYQISNEEIDKLIRNQNNDYSPYIVEEEYVNLGKKHNYQKGIQKDEPIYDDSSKNKDASLNNQSNPIDKIVIYRDLDNNGKAYVNFYVIDRFKLNDSVPTVRIDEALCYQISNEEIDKLIRNQNNDYSPYIVEEEYVNLGKKHNYQKGIQKDEPIYDDSSKNKDASLNNQSNPIDKIVIYRDLDNNGKAYVNFYVIDRFKLNDSVPTVRIDEALCYQISNEEIDKLIRNQNNDYSPYIVEEEYVNLGKKHNYQKGIQKDEPIYDDRSKNKDASLSNETILKDEPIYVDNSKNKNNTLDDGTILKDKIVIYRDLDDVGLTYVKKNVLTRFDIRNYGQPVRINGALCYQIGDTEVEKIIRNQNNDYSPYIVEEEYVNVEKEYTPEYDTDDLKKKDNLILKTIYRDLNDNGQLYASSDLINRFGIVLKDKSTRNILGNICYKISPEMDYIINNLAKESSNPKIKIEYRDVKLSKNNKKTSHDNEEIILTLYKDLNDNGQLYASSDIIDRYNLNNKLSDKSTTDILDKKCYKINRDIDDRIKLLASKEKNPKVKIEYKEVNLKKREPHLEEIIYKLTKGLDLRPRDAIKWANRTAKLLESYKQELNSGRISYNIVHFVPATISFSFKGISKGIDSVFVSSRGKNATEELKKRIDALTDEELEVLFKNYKGNVLKSAMNLQIDPMLLPKIKEFGLKKVQKLNDQIKKNYEELFISVVEIQAIDKQLQNKNGEIEAKSLRDNRANLLHKAATNVKNILKYRREANDLLSSGVHGIEEDFKAMATKLNYAGLAGPFGILGAKTNDFDNELQSSLAAYGKVLNTGLETGNEQDIVDGFMGLEKIYAENTKIEKGIFGGERSVGKKYYSPLAEVLDYRDDQFLRDLITTTVLATSIFSAYQAYHVHNNEIGDYVTYKNQEIADANKVNRQTAANVRQQGFTISGHEKTFQEGMAAQQQEDILANANTVERANLDLTGWKFNNAYHAADHASHTAYNQFADQISQKVGDIAKRYGQGTIDQQTALREMSQLTAETQSTLNDVVNSSLPILRQYAQTHPQFDLHAVEEAMNYLSSHPDAITNMNDATLEMMNIGNTLQGVTAAEVSAISALPSDMVSTLVSAAAATVMAGRICATMEDGIRKGKYGNKVTDMMDEYISSQEEDREPSFKKSR